MKKLLLLLALAFSTSVDAQDDKTVTLTVSGQIKSIKISKIKKHKNLEKNYCSFNIVHFIRIKSLQPKRC